MSRAICWLLRPEKRFAVVMVVGGGWLGMSGWPLCWFHAGQSAELFVRLHVIGHSHGPLGRPGEPSSLVVMFCDASFKPTARCRMGMFSRRGSIEPSLFGRRGRG